MPVASGGVSSAAAAVMATDGALYVREERRMRLFIAEGVGEGVPTFTAKEVRALEETRRQRVLTLFSLTTRLAQTTTTT
jgi:hypothetical protein